MIFTVPHASLPRRLGISPALLVSLRTAHLEQGTDYDRVGRALFYTEEAVARLIQLVDASRTEPPQTAVTLPPAPLEGTLVVHRAKKEGVQNRYIIEAFPLGADPLDRSQLVRVRVSDNEHFVPGMELPARQVEGDYWECTRKAPRTRGRW